MQLPIYYSKNLQFQLWSKTAVEFLSTELDFCKREILTKDIRCHLLQNEKNLFELVAFLCYSTILFLTIFPSFVFLYSLPFCFASLSSTSLKDSLVPFKFILRKRKHILMLFQEHDRETEHTSVLAFPLLSYFVISFSFLCTSLEAEVSPVWGRTMDLLSFSIPNAKTRNTLFK